MLIGRQPVAPGVPSSKATVAAPRPLGGNTEFASWSPLAKDLTPGEAALAGKRCKADQLHFINTAAAQRVVGSSHIRLVDRRGGWTMVLLGGGAQPGYDVICLNEVDSHGAVRNGGGSGTDRGTAPAPVASDTVAPTSGVTFGDANGSTTCVAGPAGSDVVSVVINTVEHGPVEATVRGGCFAAWWPAPAWPKPEKGKPSWPPLATPTYTFTLTLKDGTVRANIPLAQLSPKHP
jgi:hypothetical protein